MSSPPPFTADDVHAGQAIYGPRLLAWYDLLVLGLSCRLIWNCPAHEALALYDENISADHVEVGVGTGYFLDRCRFPMSGPRIALVDLNRNCLEQTARRIARYSPDAIQASVLQPLNLAGRTFDSAGLNFVLHCLPGNLHEKAIAFDHLHDVLRPGGVLFGSTILAVGVPLNWAARRLMPIYNRRKIFSNAADSLDDLGDQLRRRFTECAIRVRGSVALFRGRKPAI